MKRELAFRMIAAFGEILPAYTIETRRPSDEGNTLVRQAGRKETEYAKERMWVLAALGNSATGNI